MMCGSISGNPKVGRFEERASIVLLSSPPRSGMPATRWPRGGPVRGHIARKGNRYYAVVYEGTNPATGKERHRWYPGGATRREAEKVLGDLVKRIHDGDYRSPERITVGDYLTERWLPLRKRQVRHSTWRSYVSQTRLHVVPYIGNVPLQRLTADDLDGLYDELLTSGRRNGAGGGLSPKAVRNVHGMLHKALADACRKGNLQRNVADLADPPKPGHSSAMRVWTAEQLRQFLTEIADHPLGVAFHLAAHTGVRRGEVLGLPWRDVDLDGARISVRQAIINVEYRKTLADVKTPTSRRTIDLDERTVDVLRSWREHQKKQAAIVGRALRDDDTVFARADGDTTHPDYFSQVFDRHLATSELPRIRLHDLRHTHASILLKAGVPVKVVSERLGHSSPAFTMTVYQHVLPGMQADAARLFGEALYGD
jgi:integrase